MALVNYATREINAKIVYYGPGLSGKTTNIHYIFERIKPKNKGKLISLATQGDRTLFFDFLPVELGSIRGFKTRFHLYTVPGQVFYNSTRKLVLKGADGVVFVADSQKMMMDENLQSMENLKTNLTDMGLRLDKFPVVIQYNKRDLPNAADVEEMNEYLNPLGLPYFEASAVTGDGVLKTMTAIVKFIMHDLTQEPDNHDVKLEVFSEKDGAREENIGEILPEEEPAPAAAQISVSATDDVPYSRESVWGEEVPAASQDSVPAFAVPAPAAEQAVMADESRLDLSGRITLPSGVMDMPFSASEEAAQQTVGTAINFPAIPPEIFGALEAVETASVYEDEEIYEAVEVPDELGEAIKDDIHLPMADAIRGDGGNAPPKADEPVKFDEQEKALFSELSGDVHAVNEVPAPIEWDEALQEAEVYVEEAHEDEAVPLADAGGKDLFDVYFGRKAARPSMPAEELGSELEHEFAEDATPAAEHPVMGSRQVFTIPVRITTTDGNKEVTLKVSVEVELEGEGIDSITKVEVLQPYPRMDSKSVVKPADEARLKPPDPVRPARNYTPISMPKTPDKKFSVLQKILGMK